MSEPDVSMDLLAALRLVQQAAAARSAAVFVGNGYLARALYSLGDDHRYFYMMGSMGCCAPLAAGFASQREVPTLALEGDANFGMGLSSTPAVANGRSSDFLHVVFDNGVCESTGGHCNLSSRLRYAEVGLALGYRRSLSVTTLEALGKALEEAAGTGPALLHLTVGLLRPPRPPRIPLCPEEITTRFSQHWSRP